MSVLWSLISFWFLDFSCPLKSGIFYHKFFFWNSLDKSWLDFSSIEEYWAWKFKGLPWKYEISDPFPTIHKYRSCPRPFPLYQSPWATFYQKIPAKYSTIARRQLFTIHHTSRLKNAHVVWELQMDQLITVKQNK